MLWAGLAGLAGRLPSSALEAKFDVALFQDALDCPLAQLAGVFHGASSARGEMKCATRTRRLRRLPARRLNAIFLSTRASNLSGRNRGRRWRRDILFFHKKKVVRGAGEIRKMEVALRKM